jgi:hypothetical protein
MVCGGARRPDTEEDIVPRVFGSCSLKLNLARDELPAGGHIPNCLGAKERSQ